MKLQAWLEEEHKYLPLFWIGFSIILLIADYYSGPYIQFPVTFLIPISLATWYSGILWGLILAIALPLIRLYFNIAFWTIPWTYTEASINCIIRITVFVLFVVLIRRVSKQTYVLRQEVNLLKGLLPICSHCKKIRNESNQWQQIESYISEHSGALFTHSICPECIEKYYPEYFKKANK